MVSKKRDSSIVADDRARNISGLVSFKKEFSRWINTDDAWEFLSRRGFTSFMAGGCDVLAAALSTTFRENFSEIVSITLRSRSTGTAGDATADHVAAVLKIQKKPYVVDGMGVTRVDGWADAWAEYEGIDTSLVVLGQWNRIPIDKSIHDFSDASSELSKMLSTSFA